MSKASRTLAVAILVTAVAAGPSMAAVHLSGQVQAGGGAVAQSAVTLWAASAGAPKMLAQTQTGSDGRFAIASDQSAGDDAILYLVAAGGVATVNKATGDNKAIGFIAVLGSKPPATVVVKEFTTVASVWTATQFLDGTAIKGYPLGLRIAAANVPNFVDLETGGYGTAIQDALNSTQTPTMANFATLADLLAGCATRVTIDACGKLFTAATPPAGGAPTDTLGAAEAIARYPWHQPDRLTWGVLRQGLSTAHVFFSLQRIQGSSPLCYAAGDHRIHSHSVGHQGPHHDPSFFEETGLRKVGSISLRRPVAATSVHDRHLPGSGRPTLGPTRGLG